MSCSQFDVKAYFLSELTEVDRRQFEGHLRSCQDCREELEWLRITRTALEALPDEEPPRRVTFVSDRIFEPSGWRRFWDSAPRLGFASAALLSAAIFVHAFTRPPATPAPGTANMAAVEARVETEVGRRVQAAVEKAVAESQDRQKRQTAELVAAMEDRVEQRWRSELLTVEDELKYLRKKAGVYYTASASFEGPR